LNKKRQMELNILAFGVAREILGGASIPVQLDGAVTVKTLKDQLEDQYPALKRLPSFMIAVNSAYASPSDHISPGDEVAIIPPVSGG
jgi:molybdopterin converting factor subunit 1